MINRAVIKSAALDGMMPVASDQLGEHKMTFRGIYRTIFTVVLLAVSGYAMAQDWRAFANFQRYAEANTQLVADGGVPASVVFMGDSITEGWSRFRPDFFPSHGYVNRGISGQTTPQMVTRFRADVIDLQPRVVVILAGTNDLAQNTGAASLDEIAGQVQSMSELAAANGIAVIICSVLPALDYLWKPGLEPVTKIPRLNAMLKAYAETRGHVYVDYYAAMVDEQGGLKVPEYTSAGDLVHPNAAGYEVMEALVVPAIDRVLSGL